MSTANEVVSVSRDTVISEKFLDTPYGFGSFIAQTKLDRKSGEKYILLKISGGETTLYMRMSQVGALDLKEIIAEIYPERYVTK